MDRVSVTTETLGITLDYLKTAGSRQAMLLAKLLLIEANEPLIEQQRAAAEKSRIDAAVTAATEAAQAARSEADQDGGKGAEVIPEVSPEADGKPSPRSDGDPAEPTATN